MRDVLRDVLNGIDDDDSSAMIGEIPLTPSGHASHMFEMPEAVGPAMDATFYYVLCTMSLIAAAFGNFLIVSLFVLNFLSSGVHLNFFPSLVIVTTKKPK